MRRIRSGLADGTYASLRDVVTEQHRSNRRETDKPPVTDR
jgi:hypothetical protein